MICSSFLQNSELLIWTADDKNAKSTHLRMRCLCCVSILFILQNAKGLTNVMVRTQRLGFYRRRGICYPNRNFPNIQIMVLCYLFLSLDCYRNSPVYNTSSVLEYRWKTMPLKPGIYSITFKVKAAHNVHIGLSAAEMVLPFYEIGKWR